MWRVLTGERRDSLHSPGALSRARSPLCAAVDVEFHVRQGRPTLTMQLGDVAEGEQLPHSYTLQESTSVPAMSVISFEDARDDAGAPLLAKARELCMFLSCCGVLSFVGRAGIIRLCVVALSRSLCRRSPSLALSTPAALAFR